VLPPHDDAALKWQDYIPQETLFWRVACGRRWAASTSGSGSRWTGICFCDSRRRGEVSPPRPVPRRVPRSRHSKTMTVADTTGPRRWPSSGAARMAHVTPQEVLRGLRSYYRRHVVYHRLYTLAYCDSEQNPDRPEHSRTPVASTGVLALLLSYFPGSPRGKLKPVRNTGAASHVERGGIGSDPRPRAGRLGAAQRRQCSSCGPTTARTRPGIASNSTAFHMRSRSSVPNRF